MSLQTNIEIRTAPSQNEELQKEIVSMLANLMNGKADVCFGYSSSYWDLIETVFQQYSDLLELKKVLMSAAESASSSSDEMPDSPRAPQVCQKAASKLHTLVSSMTDRRDKKFKTGTPEYVGRKEYCALKMCI